MLLIKSLCMSKRRRPYANTDICIVTYLAGLLVWLMFMKGRYMHACN